MLTTKIANNTFTISANKTLYWHDVNALIIADAHLGKSTHFRKHGMALPNYVGVKDLENLSALLQKTKANKVIFLGDLFHSDYNKEWDQFVQLRLQFAAIQFILIEGNHDVLAMHNYTTANIEVLNIFTFNGISLLHEPAIIENQLVIAGHIHPGITLEKKGSLSITLPCFALNKNYLLMPAFGASTGVVPLNKRLFKKVWLVAEQDVIEL